MSNENNKGNLFKAIGKAAGSTRQPKTEADKCNYAALKNAATNCETLRDGKRLVSASKQQYRKLNAQTTAETVFQLLKRGVSPEVVVHYSSAGNLEAVSERYDWCDIFTATEEDGVSLTELAESQGVDASKVMAVFGLTEVESTSEVVTEASNSEKDTKAA